MNKRKKGETAQRIYKLLRRNPGLTTNEIAQHLPDLDSTTVQLTVSRMRQRGEVERRAKKLDRGSTGKVLPGYTYHVKYNIRPQPQPKMRLKAQPTPKVEVPKVELPKVVDTQPVWQPSDAKPEPEAPLADREVLMLRHLTDIYKAMHLMTEQQDTLLVILKDTLLDLAETKDELERERQRRNWWDKVKELF